MAELVGLVAAGVAFAEVTAKIGVQVFTLKQQWEDLKEIPDTVRQLTDDIELIGSTLQEMEADLNTPSLDGVVWAGTINAVIVTTCRGALDSLTKSINDLSQEINSSKYGRRVKIKGKILLNKEFWASHESRLRRVIWMLGVAQQQWTISLMKRQPDLILSRLEQSKTDETSVQAEEQVDEVGKPYETAQKPYTATRDGHFNQGQQYLLTKRGIMPTIFGAMRISSASPWPSSGKQNARNNPMSEYAIDFKTPSWLTQKAWNIFISVSHSGFNVNLRTYSVVSQEAPVMRCAWDGNIEGLLKLFDEKAASPFDITEDGDRLIDMAIFSGDAEVLRTMINWGLDLQQCFDRAYGARVLMPYFYRLPEESSLQERAKLVAIHELALARNIYEDLASSSDSWFLSGEESHKASLPQGRLFDTFSRLYLDPFVFKLFLPHLRPGHYDLPVTERLFMPYVVNYIDPDCLRYMLWRDGEAQGDDIRALGKIGIELRRFLAKQYISHFCHVQGWVNREYVSRCRQLCRDITRHMDLLQCYTEPITDKRKRYFRINAFHGTDFQEIIVGRYYGCYYTTCEWHTVPSITHWRRAIETTLRNWLTDMKASGVDLKEYGKMEANVFMEDKLLYSQRENFQEPATILLRPTQLAYGPKPEDWNITWEIDYQDILAEFWELIENPPLNIIGAWVN